MKGFIQFVSTASVVVGLLIALYSWQAQNIAATLAQEQAQEQNQDSWFTPVIPIEERALGLAFGFGLSFLGAFGLYAQLRIPKPPAA